MILKLTHYFTVKLLDRLTSDRQTNNKHILDEADLEQAVVYLL